VNCFAQNTKPPFLYLKNNKIGCFKCLGILKIQIVLEFVSMIFFRVKKKKKTSGRAEINLLYLQYLPISTFPC
jgi:hypothetical protein